MMKKYIFVTPEGLSYKPNCDSPEPDFQDIHIFGFRQDVTIQDTLQDLIELNDDSIGNPANGHFSIRIEKNGKKNIWMRENRSKTRIAS